MFYMGIDPGKSGGLALIRVDSFDLEFIRVCPYSDSELIDMTFEIKDEPCKVVLEKVGAMPGQGVTSMFSFGQSFGFIRGVLEAYGIPYELVPPQKWKKEFSVTKDKNTSVNAAKRLFPAVGLKRTDRCTKDHDGMAEALLMAEYARRHMK